MPKGIYIRTNKIKESMKKHGMSGTRPYRIWTNMMSRCYNSKSTSFGGYGGRGIRVCDRWHSFILFWEDMKSGYYPELTIDRILNNKNYEKSNCRWITLGAQQNNRRDTTLLTYKRKTQNISQWCGELGLNVTTVIMRIYSYGWSVEDALATPVRAKKIL